MPIERTAKFGGANKISVKVAGPGSSNTDFSLSKAVAGGARVPPPVENTTYLVGNNVVIEIVGSAAIGPIRVKPPPPPPPFQDGDWIQIKIG